MTTTTTTPTAEEIREQLTVALIFRPARPDGVVLIKRQAAYPPDLVTADLVTAGLVGASNEVETLWRLEQTGPNEWTAALTHGGPTVVMTDTYAELLVRLSDRGLWAR